MVFQRGTSFAQKPKMSVMRRIDGFGGKAYVPRAAYSFRMSFWIVPESAFHSVPRRRATARRRPRRTDAVALIVIEIDTSPSGMPSRSVSMSSIESIATPTRPTSPRARAWSESKPIWVGRSKATERPVCPWERR